MKKIMSFVLAAAALTLSASCQKEINPEDLSNADAPVTVTVQLPEGINTKAYGDGTTVDKVYFEIWSEGFATKLAEQNAEITDSKASFEFQLVRGAVYSFVFWAVNDANTVYDWSDLSEITLDYGKLNADASGNPAGNSEAMDAFYGNCTTSKIAGGESIEVNLKRPFAQLNFGTNDMSNSSVGTIKVNSTSITVDNVATVFNATIGIGSEPQKINFVSSSLPSESALSIESQSYTYLSMNYLLPSGSEAATPAVTAKFEITYNTSEVKTVEHSFPSVTIKANYRTNIIGSLFTASGSVTATIVDEFATPAGQVAVNDDGKNTTTPIP